MANEGTKRERAEVDKAKAEQSAPDDAKVVGVEDAQEAGYVGYRRTKHDDEEYALTSGPDSPSGPNGPE